MTIKQLSIQAISYTTDRQWEGLEVDSDSPATLVLAFGASSIGDDPEPFHQLRRAFPRAVIGGCSTAGEIQGATLHDGSIRGAVVRFNFTRIAAATAPVRTNAESFQAGECLARQLSHDELRGVLVFSDGLNVNGTELARGLNANLPAGVVVSGGLAADGAAFRRTWVLRDGLPVSGLVSCIAFYGDRVRIGHGSRGGWDVFGPERVVTRSEGNVLYELDGKPALPLYKKYLGERAEELPASALLFPLSLRKNRGDSRSLVRSVLAVDEDAGSLTFAGDVPHGHLAQLMSANFDRLIDGAGASALMTRAAEGPDCPCLAVAISCVGRRLVLGDRAEEELERTVECLPAGAVQVGFYSYGELSPHAGGSCELHNQTMTLTTIREQ